jgi:hypothetical protein
MLVNVIAGGVARDVIRSARLIADFGDLTSETISSCQALEHLVTREAQSKIEAAILDIRSTAPSEDVERAVARLDRIGAQFPSYDFDRLITELRAICAEPARDPGVSSPTAPAPSTSGASSDEGPDENPIVVIQTRTVSYLAFLRLIEMAFSEDGPITALAADRPGRFVDLPPSALEALENLRRAKEWLGAGCTTACFRLESAAERLREVDAMAAPGEATPIG